MFHTERDHITVFTQSTTVSAGEKPVHSLIRQLVSFYMIMFILLSVRKREKNISKKFWITEFFKCSAE